MNILQRLFGKQKVKVAQDKQFHKHIVSSSAIKAYKTKDGLMVFTETNTSSDWVRHYC
jgi:hypothetical protein